MDDCEAPFANRDEVAKLRGIIVAQDEVESPENSLQVIPASGLDWHGRTRIRASRFDFRVTNKTLIIRFRSLFFSVALLMSGTARTKEQPCGGGTRGRRFLGPRTTLFGTLGRLDYRCIVDPIRQVTRATGKLRADIAPPEPCGNDALLM